MTAETEPTADGNAVWWPSSESRSQSRVGQFMDWVQDRTGRDLASYQALWEWSVTDIEGFWAAVWDYFEVRSHAPPNTVLESHEMPGTVWFPGALLNYAEHAVERPGDFDRIALMGRSQTRPDVDLTFRELRDHVGRAQAACSSSVCEPATAWSAICRTPRRPSSPSSQRRVSERSGPAARSSSAPVRSLRGSRSSSRSCSSRRRATVRDEAGLASRRGHPDPGRTPQPALRDRHRVRRDWRTSGLGRGRPCSTSTPEQNRTSPQSLSIIPSQCSSPPARPENPSRSSTDTAASCSSTSRTTPSPGTSARTTGCSGTRPPRG